MSRVDDMFNRLSGGIGNAVGSVILMFILIGVWLVLTIAWVGFVIACLAGWIAVSWVIPVVTGIILAIPLVWFLRQ